MLGLLLLLFKPDVVQCLFDGEPLLGVIAEETFDKIFATRRNLVECLFHKFNLSSCLNVPKDFTAGLPTEGEVAAH